MFDHLLNELSSVCFGGFIVLSSCCFCTCLPKTQTPRDLGVLFSLKATLNKTCLWGWPNGICSSESSHDGWRHPYTRGGPLDKCEILRASWVGVHFIPYCWWIKFCEPKQNTGRLNCAILTANKTMAFPAILHQIHHGCIGIPGMQLVQRLGFFGDWLGMVFESLL